MARKRGRGVSDVAKYTGGRASTAPPFGAVHEDEPPISHLAFSLIVLVSILLLLFLAVRFGTARIESDLETRVTGALLTAGYPNVAVDAVGSSIHLSGSITTDQDQSEAMAVAGSVRGVSAVQGSVWPVFTGEPTEVIVTGDGLDIRWGSGFVIVSGSISTPEKKTFIADTLASTFPGGVSVGKLTPTVGLENESAWLGTTIGLVQRFATKLPAGRVAVNPDARLLAVVGVTEDKALRNELNQLAAETGASLGFSVTAGIRLSEPPPPETDVEVLQVSLDQLIEGKVVEFNVKSYDLTEEGMKLLDEISTALEKVPNVRVEIAGHTDSHGSDQDNLTLSEQRATAVLDYLVAKGAVRDRFDVIGYGEAKPIADNTTASGRARNRRIEFRALSEG